MVQETTLKVRYTNPTEESETTDGCCPETRIVEEMQITHLNDQTPKRSPEEDSPQIEPIHAQSESVVDGIIHTNTKEDDNRSLDCNGDDESSSSSVEPVRMELSVEIQTAGPSYEFGPSASDNNVEIDISSELDVHSQMLTRRRGLEKQSYKKMNIHPYKRSNSYTDNKMRDQMRYYLDRMDFMATDPNTVIESGDE